MRNQRGASLSPFIAVLLPALLVMIGLVIDGGAQAAAARRAEGVAAAAARAASDHTAAARLAGVHPDRAAAAAAGREVITAAGLAGSVEIDQQSVRVTTKASTSTVLLSLIGIDALESRGSATAALIPDR